MNPKTLMVCGAGLLLASIGTATPEKFSFNHKYRVGDRAVYRVVVVGHSKSMPESKMTWTSTEEVVKVYGDGGAEIRFSDSDLSIIFNGQALPQKESGDAPTMRVTRLGAPNELSDSNTVRISLPAVASYGLAGLQKGLAVGQSAPFVSVDPPLVNTHYKGTTTLVAVKDGRATVHVIGESIMDFDAPTDHGHLEGTYIIQVASGKLLKADFIFTDPSVRGGGVTHFEMTSADAATS